MSYANGTTHYNLPQTVGTDKRDWFDTNQAFADIDEALYGAVQQSTSTAAAVTALTTRVGEAESDIATIQASQSTDEANIAALQTLTSQHTTQIADVKADALDMICAVDEGTAQVATVAVAEGNYFRYNDVLYMATTDIAVGDTIVPNTNCRATNVATEINKYHGLIKEVVGDGVKTLSAILNELYSAIPSNLTDEEYANLKLEVSNATLGTQQLFAFNYKDTGTVHLDSVITIATGDGITVREGHAVLSTTGSLFVEVTRAVNAQFEASWLVSDASTATPTNTYKLFK